MIFDFTIITKNIDGLCIYAINVLEKILKYNNFDDDIFLLHHSQQKKYGNQIKNLKIINNTTFHRMKIGFFLKDIYYSPTHHGPIFHKNKIITIHDLIPLIYRNKSLKQYIYYRYLLSESIYNTIKIITVSNYTKQMIVKYFNLSKRIDDILVIHNGTDIEKVKEIEVLNLPKKYLFFPGVHSDYKNYKNVVEAFKGLKNKDLFLVVTTTSPNIISYLSRYKFVKIYSNLSYNQIKYLYTHSKGVIYPSLIEGFGLPVLEAARLKKPVITTINSPMSEFIGDKNAIFVDPYSIDQIRNAIIAIEDTNLQPMINNAYQQTINLTWDNHYNKLRNVLIGLKT